MKRFSDMKTYLKPFAAAAALALAAGPAAAVDVLLCAGATTKMMPDGSLVPMWGYALDDDGDLDNGCGNPITIPGPRLTVPAGDTALNITLRNDLPEPTSIVIPGLPMPTSGGTGPTWSDGTTGVRTSLDQRVRSFGAEAVPGATEVYNFTVNRPGSFIYHSGTHPQKQAYMGLYGPVTQNAVDADAVAGVDAEAYAGVPYDSEVMLFYSDIDPDLNASIAELYTPTGLVTPYTTSIDYHARWFLINGEPYVDGVTPDIPAGVAGQDTLLRFFSAASETHVPVLQGMHMLIHAEDGLPYDWEDTTTGEAAMAPREQYSAMLPPLKTKDAVITLPATVTRFAVYDGNGYMTNPSDPADTTVGDTVGGMLRFLSVAANSAPVATDDAYSVDQDTVLDVPAPGVLENDTDVDGDPLTAVLVTDPASGTLTLNADGSFTYTPNAGFLGDDSFTYLANDGLNDSNIATVTITVSSVVTNTPPVANDDTATTAFETPVTIDVLANDTDAEGDALSIAVFDATSANGGTVSCTTTCAYTPPAGFSGTDTFTYQASDGTDLSNVATVTITVEAPINTAPVAVDDSATTAFETPVTIDVLANDTDAEGDALSIAVFDATSANGGTVSCTTTCAYTPPAGFSGTDTFTYQASDGTDLSNVATVTITVNPAVATQLTVTVNGVPESHDVLTYGGAQDVASTVELLDGGATLRIVGNGWKQVVLNAPYTVTADTVLEVTFSSGAEGEIHAIGFDNDDAISPGTAFQFFGTQNWTTVQAFNDYVSGTVTYTIPVGTYFTGTFTRIIFAMDHDVVNPTGESVFSNISVTTPPPPQLNVTIDGTPTALNVLSYGGTQDVVSTTEILNGGNTLSIVGNGWKQVQFNCTITSTTNLSFSFSSAAQGEIHGIGFDIDDGISANRTFQLYGTQTYGIQNFRNYAGGTVNYSIPVGTFYTGTFSRLFFAMDHDVANPTGESVFSSVAVTGCGTAVAAQALVAEPAAALPTTTTNNGNGRGRIR